MMGKDVVTSMLLIGIALWFSYLLLEWVGGCGESYVDANGTVHYGLCIFYKEWK